MLTTRQLLVPLVVLFFVVLRTRPLWARPKRCWTDTVYPHLISHYCYQDLCLCNNYALDCSSNFGNLTYVPRGFDGVRVLNFSNNNLKRIVDVNFFQNVSDTVWLVDLFNNEMTFIVEGVFDGFRNLTTLLIGGNNLSYPALKPVFAIPTLLELQLLCAQLDTGPPGYVLRQSLMKNLTYLDLSWNYVETLDLHDLQPLRSLTNFSLWSNKLYNLTTASMPALVSLSLYENRLFDFPVTCRSGTKESLFPELVELHLRYNMMVSIRGSVCLPKLEFLNLEFNRFMYFNPNTFSGERFPRLSDLFLNEMESKIIEIHGYTFNNSALKFIDLRLNHVDFSSEGRVHNDTFGGCTNLERIALEKNDFSSVSDEKMALLFGRLPELRILNLGSTSIRSITPDTFAELKSLQTLKLYENSLSEVPRGAIDRLFKLTEIDLDGNQISVITSETFNKTTRDRLQKIYLGGNPFDCSCRILWLQQWMRERPILFQDYHSAGYNCINIHMKLNQFYLDDQACLLSHSANVAVIVVCTIIIGCITAVSLLFGFRWHLRLKLYECCQGRDRRHWANRRVRRFQYDLFVSYAEEDVGWVRGELLPLLEDQWGLKLCVHHRDFIPGKHIIDNISYCVEESERILMVFSSHFAASHWCQFELKMCQTCVMDRDDVLVLVTIGNTASYELTGAMLAVISTTTYLEWEANCEDRRPFWTRLRIALDDIFINAQTADLRDDSMIMA